jgi:processive 1,2-diacylglycerol beta-glucosyltransferase
VTSAPRILVLSASVGAGHLRAAQAVTLALQEIVPNAVVRNLDVLETTNAVFRYVYGKAYLGLVNNAPHLLGYFYDVLDRPRRQNNMRDRFRLALERLQLRSFIRLLESEPWDLAICTHFLPAEIVAYLRRKGRLTLPQLTATTDFETHRMWVNQPCERYTTATEEGSRNLHRWGIPTSDTRVTGIPIHPVFAQAKSQAECRARHGIGTDRQVILQLAGGFGVGPVVELSRSLLSIERPVELVVIAGKNARLKADLEKRLVPGQHRVTVLSFTDQIDELMAAADVVVSKPGGLTTSEVLARGAAMVIVNPIPGQEDRNSDYLLESGAAIKANNAATLAYKVATLLDDPKRLQQVRESAARIGRPRAAFDVAEEGLRLLGASLRGPWTVDREP